MASNSYMKAPDPEFSYEVGDIVEVYCDHEKGGARVRGWLKGIVVQVDSKMVAVQFRSNVFLTDGWSLTIFCGSRLPHSIYANRSVKPAGPVYHTTITSDHKSLLRYTNRSNDFIGI